MDFKGIDIKKLILVIRFGQCGMPKRAIMCPQHAPGRSPSIHKTVPGNWIAAPQKQSKDWH
jgi:hypothetical protein